MFRISQYFIAAVICCGACHKSPNPYGGDPAISDVSGNPKDSVTFYFPQCTNPDSGFLKESLDSFKENWYSSALYAFREPVLYNYYLNKEIYRFLWLRSFHRPVVFTLTKSADQVTLTTKALDKQPQFIEHKYNPRGWPGLEEELAGLTYEKIGDSLIVVKADRKADMVYNKTQTLSLKNWNAFEELLQKANFWNMPANGNEERGTDGSEWIMEAHQKQRYWFVARWMPTNEFQQAGIYLIQLSGLKEKIY